MKRVEYIVKKITDDIVGKHVLEVACGCAEFSLEASKIAQLMECIDLDDSKLLDDVLTTPNINFKVMDATNLTYEKNTFDTVVLYNSIGHLEDCFKKVLTQAQKVLKSGGVCYIFSSSKMDINLISKKVLPYIDKKGIEYEYYIYKVFDIIKFKK